MWKKCEQCGANHLALTRGLCAACYEQDRQRKPLPTAADRGTADADPTVSRASVQYWVMRSLRTNAVLAARRGDRAPANPAIELIGRHLGMFIDRKVVEINTVDDSDEYLQRLMEIVGIKTIDNEPASLQLESDGLNDGSSETG